MRLAVLLLPLAVHSLSASAKLEKDTITTRQNNHIILTYDISVSGDNVAFRVDGRPRIIPGDNLLNACDGDLARLKVVLFDKVGDFGKVRWNGISPIAFTVPSGLSYDKSDDGYYILGETTTPVSFKRRTADKHEIAFPLYIAVYEKKQTYKLVDSGSIPLKVSIGKTVKSPRSTHADTEIERIAIQSQEEIEADNDDITKALSCMQMIRQLLASETEFPFSQTLQMEIYNLRSLKDRVKDKDVIDKINETLLQCGERERALKEIQKEATSAAYAQEQANVALQKAEEEARRKEAEEKAVAQEEKQQKRTLWMIIGGVILAVLAFIGNAVFKHFRDVRNQRSIMEMQESLARQAEHEAGRRSREIVRNKAHQVVNRGKSKIRESLKEKDKTKKNTKIKSI